MNIRVLLFVLILIVIYAGCGDSKKGLNPVIPVTYDSNADWSPDGKYIIFSRAGNPLSGRLGGIYRYDIVDSSLSILLGSQAADLVCPRYSPDGSKIIFSQYGDLYIINLSNDSISQITFKGDIYYPDWSPDGRRIAYHDFHGDERGVYIMDLESGINYPMPEYYEMPIWFSDGQSLAVISYKYEDSPQIIRVDTLGNQMKKLTDTPSWKFNMDIDWNRAPVNSCVNLIFKQRPFVNSFYLF